MADEDEKKSVCTLCGEFGLVTEMLGAGDDYAAPLYRLRYEECPAWRADNSVQRSYPGVACRECGGAGCYEILLCDECGGDDDMTEEQAVRLRNRVQRARARNLGWKVNVQGGRTRLSDPAGGFSVWYERASELREFLDFVDLSCAQLPPNFLAVWTMGPSQENPGKAREHLRLIGRWTREDLTLVKRLEQRRLNATLDELAQHEAALEVCTKYGVERLGDVPGFDEVRYASRDTWREHADELLAAAPGDPVRVG